MFHNKQTGGPISRSAAREIQNYKSEARTQINDAAGVNIQPGTDVRYQASRRDDCNQPRMMPQTKPGGRVTLPIRKRIGATLQLTIYD